MPERNETNGGPTVAQNFHNDPDVKNAIGTLIEKLKFHQAAITGPKDANSELAEPYDQLVEEFCSLRGGKLFFPFLGSGIGNGALVELADGSVKYDFINGLLF